MPAPKLSDDEFKSVLLHGIAQWQVLKAAEHVYGPDAISSKHRWVADAYPLHYANYRMLYETFEVSLFLHVPDLASCHWIPNLNYRGILAEVVRKGEEGFLYIQQHPGVVRNCPDRPLKFKWREATDTFVNFYCSDSFPLYSTFRPTIEASNAWKDTRTSIPSQTLVLALNNIVSRFVIPLCVTARAMITPSNVVGYQIFDHISTLTILPGEFQSRFWTTHVSHETCTAWICYRAFEILKNAEPKILTYKALKAAVRCKSWSLLSSTFKLIDYQETHKKELRKWLQQPQAAPSWQLLSNNCTQLLDSLLRFEGLHVEMRDLNTSERIRVFVEDTRRKEPWKNLLLEIHLRAASHTAEDFIPIVEKLFAEAEASVEKAKRARARAFGRESPFPIPHRLEAHDATQSPTSTTASTLSDSFPSSFRSSETSLSRSTSPEVLFSVPLASKQIVKTENLNVTEKSEAAAKALQSGQAKKNLRKVDKKRRLRAEQLEAHRPKKAKDEFDNIQAELHLLTFKVDSEIAEENALEDRITKIELEVLTEKIKLLKGRLQELPENTAYLKALLAAREQLADVESRVLEYQERVHVALNSAGHADKTTCSLQQIDHKHSVSPSQRADEGSPPSPQISDRFFDPEILTEPPPPVDLDVVHQRASRCQEHDSKKFLERLAQFETSCSLSPAIVNRNITRNLENLPELQQDYVDTVFRINRYRQEIKLLLGERTGGLSERKKQIRDGVRRQMEEQERSRIEKVEAEKAYQMREEQSRAEYEKDRLENERLVGRGPGTPPIAVSPLHIFHDVPLTPRRRRIYENVGCALRALRIGVFCHQG